MRFYKMHRALNRYRSRRSKLTRMVIMFTVMVSVILAVTMIIVTLAMLLLSELNVIQLSGQPRVGLWIIIWALASIGVGTIMSALVSHIPLRPFHHLVQGLDRLADGDYTVRLRPHHAYSDHKIPESFNKLAEELENTEILREDFVNNFSHEFKTPIVSILGFAKLLKRGDIPQEKREEYLDIILSEATRLTDMATNVMDLAKIENQSILTDVSAFNLSEQLRTCILLLQKKWEAKQLEIDFDEHEYQCAGNEELLRQVWINLLDNAVKYAPAKSQIKINIKQQPGMNTVSIANEGEALEPQVQKRIFEKFYQADSSRATEGMGLGLAIVQKIVSLHGGAIAVTREDPFTVFAVSLPNSPLA